MMDKSHQFWAYIGNSAKGSIGIALYKLDTDAGTLTAAGNAGPGSQPNFLSISPNQKFLYAGITASREKSAVQGYSIDAKTGKLTPINSEDAHGEEACFVQVDPSGKNVLATNYNAHTVVVLPIDGAGKLMPASSVITEEGSSANPDRQTHAYSHSVNVTPDGKFAISCDLGADKLFFYHFDAAAGKLTPNDPASVSVAPGSGPRHLTFTPDGKFAYATMEMLCNVVGFSYDAQKGTLTQIDSQHLLPNGVTGDITAAEVQISPDGKFVYVSNRIDNNQITIFSRDMATGKLTLVAHQDSMGRIPRNFRIDPTGKFMIVLNQGDAKGGANIVLFSIEQATGKLTQVGQPIASDTPLCVKFLPVAGM